MSHGAGDNPDSVSIGRSFRVISFLIILVVLPVFTSVSPLIKANNPSTTTTPASIVQTTTGFDNSWYISQAGYTGIANGTLDGNVFHARLYNVIPNITGAFGPWGYSVIQKGLLDWGPATPDHLNGTLLTVTVKFNAAVNAVTPYDWHVYVGVYYHLTQPVTVNCGGTPTTRQFLDAQIQLARAFPPDTELCATGTAVLSTQQQTLVSLGQTYTLTNYNITQHFIDQARAIGLPNNVGYTEFSLEPGIEGYGNSVVSADFSNLSLSDPMPVHHTPPPASTPAPAPPPQRMSPILDSTGEKTGSGWSSSLLSTAHTNDVVIVAAYCYADLSTLNVQPCNNQVAPTVTDTAGLTYSLHKSYCSTGSAGNGCIWDYYARASTLLVDDNITISSSFRIIAFSMSNADTNNIFDPNLPVGGQHCVRLDGTSPLDYPDLSIAPSCTVGFTPSEPNNFIFEMTILYDANSCTSTMPASQSWTLLSGNAWTEVNMSTSSNNTSFTCSFSHNPILEMIDGIQGSIVNNVAHTLN